jgi:hypothetical protein
MSGLLALKTALSKRAKPSGLITNKEHSVILIVGFIARIRFCLRHLDLEPNDCRSLASYFGVPGTYRQSRSSVHAALTGAS